MSDYKILVVGGYDFNGTDATSITLKSVLGFLGPDRIQFLLTRSDANTNPYKSLCIKPKFFSHISQKSTVCLLSKARSPIAGITKKGGSHKFTFLNLIHTIGSSYRSFIDYDYTQEVDHFIKGFRPNYIYSLLASPAIMSLCTRISKRHDIPIIPHFMDDWPHVMFSNTLFLWPAKKIMQRKLRALLKRTPFCLTISSKMAKEYAAEYDKLCYPFMNCTTEILLPTQEYPSGKTLRIVYVGGLHLDREKIICSLCDTLCQIAGYNFLLTIFSSTDNWNKYGDIFKPYEFVEYGGFVNHQNIANIYANADIVLHVESFDAEIKKYTRLSISTKIPEYLSCGKPILAIGPEDIASIEYLQNNNAAIVATTALMEETANILKGILRDKRRLHELSTNARLLYKRNHVQSLQRDKLNNLLTRFMEESRLPDKKQ